MWIEGRAFEDTIDGYFPLCESLRQLLVRQGFGVALISLIHAPILKVPGLAPEAPVPLDLRTAQDGMIDRMTLIVRLDGGAGVVAGGLARWRWSAGPQETERTFSALHRLAEPAFVRGVGLAPGAQPDPVFGALAPARAASGVALGPLPSDQEWSARWTWRLPDPRQGIMCGEATQTRETWSLCAPDHPGATLSFAPLNDRSARIMDAVAKGQ